MKWPLLLTIFYWWGNRLREIKLCVNHRNSTAIHLNGERRVIGRHQKAHRWKQEDLRDWNGGRAWPKPLNSLLLFFYFCFSLGTGIVIGGISGSTYWDVFRYYYPHCLGTPTFFFNEERKQAKRGQGICPTSNSQKIFVLVFPVKLLWEKTLSPEWFLRPHCCLLAWLRSLAHQ